MKLPISVIILTYNEEINLENCLKSIANWASEIFVVDCYSTDKTLDIAKRYGAKIVQHPFENQSQQFNWALDNLDIKSDWILRLDADEYLTPELKKEIGEALFNMRTSDVSNISVNVRTSDVQEINGFYIKRRVYFMGKWVKHGGYYPLWFLRIFRKGKARCENRKVDEHLILLEGKTARLKNDFIDDNKKDLTYWIEKHNNYASREAEEILSGKRGGRKKNFYYSLPFFCRAWFYFIYRYFFRLGFLDGKKGLIFHFLQGLWYRFLVDAKIYERKQKHES